MVELSYDKQYGWFVFLSSEKKQLRGTCELVHWRNAFTCVIVSDYTIQEMLPDYYKMFCSDIKKISNPLINSESYIRQRNLDMNKFQIIRRKFIKYYEWQSNLLRLKGEEMLYVEVNKKYKNDIADYEKSFYYDK